MFLLFYSFSLLKYLLSGSMIPSPTPIMIRILIVMAGSNPDIDSNPDIGSDSDIDNDTGWPGVWFGADMGWELIQ